jgi:AraC-like DNA-binding protein
MDSSGFTSIDLGCRGAAVGVALLIAGVLLRDRPARAGTRLSAALAVGAAAYAIYSAPNFPMPNSPAQWQYWSLAILALTSGNSVVFWLWARAAFDDDFVFRPWHAALWAAVVGLGLFIACGGARWPLLGLAAGRTLSLLGLGLALLAAAQTLSTWRADLVAGRRRLRTIVLIGTSAYIVVGISLSFAPGPSASGFSMASVANALGLCVLVGLSGWSLFRAAGIPESSAVLLTTGDASSIASEGEGRPRVAEPALLRRLERLMTVERAYRREGLTIGSLSAELGVPEYRLRQLINEGLGHRNFNAFLNRYRIEEAKAALADPEQKEVPVLTVALDAGFQSIGPFNRAFKASTDSTPTEFRRLALAGHAAMPMGEADRSKIGQSN